MELRRDTRLRRVLRNREDGQGRRLIDDVKLENVGAMVTGTGGHMVSLNAKARKSLGKDIGDTVEVTIMKR